MSATDAGRDSLSWSVNPTLHRTPFSRNPVSKFEIKIAIHSNTKSFIQSVYLDHLYLLVKNMFWEVILMNITVLDSFILPGLQQN